jgi:hypothetical protein
MKYYLYVLGFSEPIEVDQASHQMMVTAFMKAGAAEAQGVFSVKRVSGRSVQIRPSAICGWESV